MRIYLSILMLMAASATAQTREFEVATIRPAAPLDRRAILSGQFTLGESVSGNQVTFRYMSLRDLAVTAFDVRPFNLTGPDWMGQERYDISALMPAGATEDDIPQMLRALLESRFKLVAHKESKEGDVYALVEAKGGHKMKPAPAVVEAPPAPEPDPAKPARGVTVNGQTLTLNPAQSIGGGGGSVSIAGRNGNQRISMGPDGQMQIEVERMTMAEAAEMLTPMLDLPVEDRTGIKGEFQVAFAMSMADMAPMISRASAAAGAGGALPPEAATRLAQMSAGDPGGAIFASVQKLGLRLEKQKGTIETVVIDSAEKTPSEN